MKRLPSLHPQRAASGWARRRPWILVAAAALGGCAGGAGADTSGAPTADAGGMTQSPGAGTGDFNSCVYVTVDAKQRTAPASFTVSSSIGTGQGSSYRYDWTVTRAGDDTPLPFTTRDDKGTAIDFTATDPGSYRFALALTNPDGSGVVACQSQDTAIAVAANAKQGVVRLRVVPPVASGLPVQESLVTVWSDTPLDDQLVALQAGVTVDTSLMGPGDGVAGTLRFLAEDPGLDVLAAAASNGHFVAQLLPGEHYQVAMSPTGSALAPRLIGQSTEGAVLALSSFSVEAGVGVSGVVKDAAGQPLVGAAVVLRGGPIESGVGVTDATGAYALRVEPGSYTVEVTAPGWPDATGAATLTVAGDTQLDVGYTATLVTSAAHVLASDATVGVKSSRVSLRSLAPLPGVAKLALPGATLAASGVVRTSALVDANGDIAAQTLPPGDYLAVVEPPAGSSDAVLAQTVTAASAATWKLQLVPRVKLQGTVSDGKSPVAGARVTVAERLGMGALEPAVLVATSDAQGHYELLVDGPADLDVTVDPPAGLYAPSATRRLHAAAKAGTTALDLPLPSGTLLAGRLAPPSGAAVAGARVEATWATTGTPGAPFAVGTSDADGRFVLYLPAPGQ